MLGVRDKGTILFIIKHCKRIIDTVEGLTEGTFLDNLNAKEIVAFNLIQIGELAKHLTDEFLKEYDKVPWRQIMGFRDKVVHGYDKIDMKAVWLIVTVDILELKEYCESIL